MHAEPDKKKNNKKGERPMILSDGKRKESDRTKKDDEKVFSFLRFVFVLPARASTHIVQMIRLLGCFLPAGSEGA